MVEVLRFFPSRATARSPVISQVLADGKKVKNLHRVTLTGRRRNAFAHRSLPVICSAPTLTSAAPRKPTFGSSTIPVAIGQAKTSGDKFLGVWRGEFKLFRCGIAGVRMKSIRLCRDDEHKAVLAIINDATKSYRGVIPRDRWHEPYMPLEGRLSDIAARGGFLGLRGGGDAGRSYGVSTGSRCRSYSSCLCSAGPAATGRWRRVARTPAAPEQQAKKVLTQRFVIGAFPWRYEGLEACAGRIVCFANCGETVEAVGDVAKAIFSR